MDTIKILRAGIRNADLIMPGLGLAAKVNVIPSAKKKKIRVRGVF